MNEDYLLESYNFTLPEDRIAQYPCQKPGDSRLLRLDREKAELEDALFRDLPDLLPEGALLVANNARVTPARIKWRRPGGGKSEFLLLSPLPLLTNSAERDSSGYFMAAAEALIRPGARFRSGQVLRICGDLECEIIEKKEFGRHLVNLRWIGSLERILQDNGCLPLPPYIKREEEPGDQNRYQTVYAARSGALAAPTAGLHFTRDLQETLKEKGFSWQEITLLVGYGTFSPVRSENILNHKMHREYVEIDTATALAIRTAREEGRPIICVGTTSLRALEGTAKIMGEPGPYSGWTDIFIYPGFDFKIASGLITNFHLPKSSLLMLAAAFAGRKEILDAYKHAIDKGYRFFSYGDAMLIL